jgi:membrane associated rhomboid family serine protease
MIIPISHEHLRGRRWPWITIGIIALNIVVFFGTHWKMEDQSEKNAEVKTRILLLAANHPGVKMPAEVQKLVDAVQKSFPEDFKKLGSRNRPPATRTGGRDMAVWDLRMREMDLDEANVEMGNLALEWQDVQNESILERYAYIPYKRSGGSYVTANFLHGGWLHIIFNMWFLWLAGSVLEDVWGRIIYPIFYFVAGAVALETHALMFPNSFTPLIGASGAVAGLMGAFLVRYFKTKIDFIFIYAIVFVPRIYRFKAPAYLMLPLWLGTQFFAAWLMGDQSGIAYWAHIGGFAFGVAVALGLKFSGIEHTVDKSIEAEVGWQADPRVVKAGELVEQNQLDAAVAELKQAVQEKPDLVEAYTMLESLYWRMQNLPAHRETLAQLCRLNIKAKNLDEAWQHYEAFSSGGGEKIGAGDWSQLCRWLESKENWEAAAREYEKFAHAYPADKLSVYSLVAAARVHLKKLNNKPEAARLYQEAAASPVPHLDWDDAIRRGLGEATS